MKDATVDRPQLEHAGLVDQIDRRAGAAVEDRGERQLGHLASAGCDSVTVAVMPSATRVVGILDGEARRVGAGRGIGLRRELAQARREAAVRARPQPHAWRATARASPSQVSGSATSGFHLAAMGEPRHRLAERHHLARLGQRRGDHAVGVGLELRIGELIAGEIERARARSSRPSASSLAAFLRS